MQKCQYKKLKSFKCEGRGWGLKADEGNIKTCYMIVRVLFSVCVVEAMVELGVTQKVTKFLLLFSEGYIPIFFRSIC